MHQHVDDNIINAYYALHTDAPIGSVLENYCSVSATKEIERSKRVSDVTSSQLSSVTRSTDNDVCVCRFVKFARQKLFSAYLKEC